MNDDAWVAARELRQKRALLPGAVLAIGMSVSLGMKAGPLTGLLVPVATVATMTAVMFALLSHARDATKTARLAGKAVFATAGLTAPMIARRVLNVPQRTPRSRSAQQPLLTGRLTVYPDRLEWRIRSSLAKGFAPPLEVLVWHAHEIASCTFRKSRGLYPAAYVTIVDVRGALTMVIFDCAKIRSDIERVVASGVQRPSDSQAPRQPG